jgi:NTP pyrophosphatase (non-canonical NTP hydrolase)
MTIDELQKWVKDDWKNNHATPPTVTLQILYLVEELGEVAEAIRKHESRYDRVGKATKPVDIGGEMGDLLISLTTLANTYNISLTKEVKGFQERLALRREKVIYADTK